MRIELYALAALVPAMIGPLPVSAHTITAQLCNGGTVTILIERDNEQQPERDCRFQACHAGTCRKRDRLTQPS
ncbi:MAG: hypothetical protein CL807_04725 [Citromicrobium sp.]|nr:hypothetical protein [Citromicrobium sp.]MAO95998.1 hypothetical protein [Citromicrobium sp.]MAS84948.1 hypothetical protein [Erythrobacteraceae bacterium]MBD76194.1 hypothetical protein [Citromicrobium sp.]MBT45888.1 hypothetical protein [Citromicrobium sp.]|tara:strand:- start:35651 stop:35869 length:219 start_codon:yes stop_codon:yes gene_type:complete